MYTIGCNSFIYTNKPKPAAYVVRNKNDGLKKKKRMKKKHKAITILFSLAIIFHMGQCLCFILWKYNTLTNLIE